MSRYRRLRVPGATYFFTVTLEQRGSAMLTAEIAALRSAYAATVAEMPVLSDAFVVLPDHLYAVWTLPDGDSDFPERWRKIKHRFTRAVNNKVGRHAHPTRSASKLRKREAGLWQRRYWEHLIRDDADYRAHVAYCWGNPVKHGLVSRAVEWPYSSIHRDIRLGRVDPEWCGRFAEGQFGEPS
ncbi:transposase [uncultured Marivita sp.]|uniref:REP-associated tyrosine transposase n=1 Tax=uncultured Marivita sp. TaxID=888080 RepID=UPI00261819AB|nr:transposase [uncultured Marivita sp.]